MHAKLGRYESSSVSPSLEVLEQYLPATESLFQGLRRTVTSLSAVILLVQLSPGGTPAGAEQGLEGTTADLQELYERSRALDRKFQHLSIHRSLSSAAGILLRASQNMRTELFGAAAGGSASASSALGAVQTAFEELKAFAAGTPWDTASINHSCASAVN
jgi:hypothetical protein